jgi:hypothetical protein
MSGRSRLLILTVVIGLVLTTTVGSAGASRHVFDTLRKSTAQSHVLGNIGRPPVVGGPYGDPGDYPGLVSSTVQGVDRASTLSPNFGAQDDCLQAPPGSPC